MAYNRDGGLGDMIRGLREPVDEDAPKKGAPPQRKRKPPKAGNGYAKKAGPKKPAQAVYALSPEELEDRLAEYEEYGDLED